ncbi:MAG TPA: glutamate synthase subunit beta [Candidatus Omnitrophota bacterium]|jgi:glutamate synthase (NADPH/NADH) small chain|nr:glutamate synthase subunit beta [Candidatus Omnitrophota bacterium]
MGEVKGFLKHDRQDIGKEPVEDRLKHWDEFIQFLKNDEIQAQGARCMDCGIPFCQSGCPVDNLIPEWNDLVYHDRWEEAIERLFKTNNFPEFTGRICPAPCENACVLGYNFPAVTIKNIELMIIERAYEKGWVKPRPPKTRTGKTVAVVGSGPAGLACADQLNKSGHKVTLYEKNERPGGLLRFGIPDFKLSKRVIDRRVDIMKKEGVEFKTGVHVGKDVLLSELKKKHHAVVLSGGAEAPRDLNVPGRELKGVYFAMEFLAQQNRVNSGLKFHGERIDVKGKKVVVIGGGDTGSDCVGTSNRQGAVSVKQFEILPRPPKERAADNPWPQWAFVERKSTSHEEGVEQDFCVMTKKLSGENGVLKKLHAIRLEFGEKDPKTGRRPMKEIEGSEFEIECDYVFLAMGFLGPVREGAVAELGLELDERGNVKADKNFMTSVPGIFAAGDLRRGQSLVVWAIKEGRLAAEGVDKFLKAKI